MTETPSQRRVTVTFALRMSASHALTLYLAWLSYTRGSVSLAAAVLALRAATGLLVPLAVGRLHDRGRVWMVLRAAAVVEAAAAVALVAVHAADTTNGLVAVVLAALLGATAALFDTVAYPLVLAAVPSRLQPHVMVGLAYDVAKIAGSSVVLALLAVSSSPFPVMAVCCLSLSGWSLARPAAAPPTARTDATEHPADPAAVPAAVSAVKAGGDSAGVRVWTTARTATLAANAAANLLPTQLVAYQTAMAEGSFSSFALLGTVFAAGAVLGNLALQRTATAARSATAGYLLGAAAMLVMIVSPTIGMALYGFAAAVFSQLTRALVVGTVPADRQGRAAGTATATTRLCGVLGAMLAARWIARPFLLIYGGFAIFTLAAAVMATVSLRRTTPRTAT